MSFSGTRGMVAYAGARLLRLVCAVRGLPAVSWYVHAPSYQKWFCVGLARRGNEIRTMQHRIA